MVGQVTAAQTNTRTHRLSPTHVIDPQEFTNPNLTDAAASRRVSNVTHGTCTSSIAGHCAPVRAIHNRRFGLLTYSHDRACIHRFNSSFFANCHARNHRAEGIQGLPCMSPIPIALACGPGSVFAPLTLLLEFNSHVLNRSGDTIRTRNLRLVV